MFIDKANKHRVFSRNDDAVGVTNGNQFEHCAPKQSARHEEDAIEARSQAPPVIARRITDHLIKRNYRAEAICQARGGC